MYWNMLCKRMKRLQHYSQYSIFGGILKTSRVAPFIAIAAYFAAIFSRPDATIIADIFMKIAGHEVMTVLITMNSPSCRLLLGRIFVSSVALVPHARGGSTVGDAGDASPSTSNVC